MRSLNLIAFVATCLFATAGYSQGIVGSAHDFSLDAWNTTGQICIVCHTPHDADTSVTSAPLWNHTLTTEVYLLYNSETLNAIPGQPNGVSKLCLSCHDGTVAVDDFGFYPPMAKSTFAPGWSQKGAGPEGLSDDHPISFTYDDTLASVDGGLHAPSTTESGLGGTIAEDMLFAGSLECASCHDVHDAIGDHRLLRIANDGSALCLTCHDK